jgi:hypothetical protein
MLIVKNSSNLCKQKIFKVSMDVYIKIIVCQVKTFWTSSSYLKNLLFGQFIGNLQPDSHSTLNILVVQTCIYKYEALNK